MIVTLAVSGGAVAGADFIRRADFADQAIAKFIPGEISGFGKLQCDCECACFPRRAEDMIGIEPRRFDQIVKRSRVHFRGASTFATPTIESRVTIAASSSSLIRAVFFGRCGMTR